MLTNICIKSYLYFYCIEQDDPKIKGARRIERKNAIKPEAAMHNSVNLSPSSVSPTNTNVMNKMENSSSANSSHSQNQQVIESIQLRDGLQDKNLGAFKDTSTPHK